MYAEEIVGLGVFCGPLSERTFGSGGEEGQSEVTSRRAFHREDGVVLPFKENLQRQSESSSREMKALFWSGSSIKPSEGKKKKRPAHSLHHVRDEAVGDAWTRLLCQVECVFQLLDGPDATAARPPLLLQLDRPKL